MRNKLLVEQWPSKASFAHVLDLAEVIDRMPAIKTYFTNYRNPIGIEVEVENHKRSNKKLEFWNGTEDGSLKISGWEWISKPVSGRQIDYALYELEDFFKATQKDLLWSHRTSIHVHQNMTTIRQNQLRAYVMLYGLFEDMFFHMVEPHRHGNPYCYPATEVDPRQYMIINPENKYCALNLYPLKTQSTVEFRHMHGSQDFKLIRRWIQLIVKMHAWVEKQGPKGIITHLRDVIAREAFVGLAKDVFGASVILFPEDLIMFSCQRNALWSLAIGEREFQ